ncbi:hypothetical protein AS026_05095 [Rhizobium altiplani]|uniref:Uncharacterized protein n=1 Tax=Rhizobium altiplani TaxID=1864509 RepID=A0A109JNR9_9HYPH|nr:hypothetical protein AS026_05095 [Rhizobium altiplani]
MQKIAMAYALTPFLHFVCLMSLAFTTNSLVPCREPDKAVSEQTDGIGQENPKMLKYTGGH